MRKTIKILIIISLSLYCLNFDCDAPSLGPTYEAEAIIGTIEYDIYPWDKTDDVLINTKLSLRCRDIEGYILVQGYNTVTLYFGKTNPPPLVLTTTDPKQFVDYEEEYAFLLDPGLI